MSERYFGLEANEHAERERLEQLERLCDPISQRRLRAVGVGEGWRCLEVGAGRGSVARWLRAQVGPGGQVVAADIDTRFLKDVPGVEVREHDVLAQPFEPGAFDLVHARALLMNVPRPEAALTNMVAALRPGGILCLEEVDWSSLSAVDRHHPHAAAFHASSHAGFEAVRASGAADGYFGRTILGLIEALNFGAVDGEGVVVIGRGGDHPAGRLQRLTLELPVTRLVVAKGVLTSEQYALLESLYEDPTFSFVGLTLFGAWGTKPR